MTGRRQRMARMHVGDRVRVAEWIASGRSIRWIAGVAEPEMYDYDRGRGDTGTIVELDRGGTRSRQARMATVELDPPNTGRMWIEARELEPLAEAKP